MTSKEKSVVEGLITGDALLELKTPATRQLKSVKP